MSKQSSSQRNGRVTESYQAVGVDELRQAAGVRKGSFYHYFSSKSDLAKAVVDLHAVAFEGRPSGPPGAMERHLATADPDRLA
jgi:TetR/AcrR family transcriptional repressor of nem operon